VRELGLSRAQRFLGAALLVDVDQQRVPALDGTVPVEDRLDAAVEPAFQLVRSTRSGTFPISQL